MAGVACLERIIGMLTQLAAATAASGTNRPISGGNRFTRLFSVKAVARAPDVARQYDLTS